MRFNLLVKCYRTFRSIFRILMIQGIKSYWSACMLLSRVHHKHGFLLVFNLCEGICPVRLRTATTDYCERVKKFKKLLLSDPKVFWSCILLVDWWWNYLNNSFSCWGALYFSNAVDCFLRKFRVKRCACGSDYVWFSCIVLNLFNYFRKIILGFSKNRYS